MAKTFFTGEAKVTLGEPEKKTVTNALFDRALGGGRLVLGLIVLLTVVIRDGFNCV